MTSQAVDPNHQTLVQDGLEETTHTRGTGEQEVICTSPLSQHLVGQGEGGRFSQGRSFHRQQKIKFTFLSQAARLM